MIAQAARGADHDMGAVSQHPGLAAGIHAADAGGDAPAGRGVEPQQFALDLERQLPGRSDHQGERRTGRRKRLALACAVIGTLAEEHVGHGETVGHGLAGAGLGRDKKIAGAGGRLQHRGLDRGGIGVAALGQGPREGGGQGREGQVTETLNGRAAPGSAPSRGGGIRHRTLFGSLDGSANRAF